MDAIEKDAAELLRLAWSAKKLFASINQVPPEVLSTIPGYCHGEEDDVDRALIAFTHVCHDWREIFISRSSLWTRLDFKNIDKTDTYIKRSQSSPLKFHLKKSIIDKDMVNLLTPNICRVKSLTIDMYFLPNILKHFHCNAPLLEKLEIRGPPRGLDLDNALFNRDLSSIRELCLHGVTTHFPRKFSKKNLANLQVLDFKYCTHGYEITQFLNILESAPLLHTILLDCKWLVTPKTPPKQIVPLHHLKVFSMTTFSRLSFLLPQLHIPTGASLKLDSNCGVDESVFLDYLPERSPYLNNLSHITAIDLYFEPRWRHVILSGPSGHLETKLTLAPQSRAGNGQILHSLSHPIFSKTQRLVISGDENLSSSLKNGEYSVLVLQMLSSMSSLQSLTLINSKSQFFILALDPENNSGVILCPDMTELILEPWKPSDAEYLIKMVKNRASRGVTPVPLSFKFTSFHCLMEEVNELKKYVMDVEHIGGNLSLSA